MTIGPALAALLSAALLGEVIAVRPLPRGTVLTPDMIELRGDADGASALGQQLRRPVFAGRPITAADLEAPDLVDRQGAVLVTYARGPLTLSLPGRALGAGGAGETVPVLIEGRRRPLRAVVTGPGTVTVAR